jgi:hypothetical protein
VCCGGIQNVILFKAIAVIVDKYPNPAGVFPSLCSMAVIAHGSRLSFRLAVLPYCIWLHLVVPWLC